MAGKEKNVKDALPGATGEMTTKDRILDVAIDLFAQKGFDAVSLREIAEAAGVRKATLYYYFTTKDEILEKILEYVSERWNQSKVGKWSDSDDAETQILAMGLDGFFGHGQRRIRELAGRPPHGEDNENRLHRAIP